MSAMPPDLRRPAVRHLVAAGLLGFVLGAFVVASLGTVTGRPGGAAAIGERRDID
jgi:hypothetical protein